MFTAPADCALPVVLGGAWNANARDRLALAEVSMSMFDQPSE